MALKGFLLFGLAATLAGSAPATPAYGLATRPLAKPYLHFPERLGSPLPQHLSETGAFLDVTNLVPSPSLIPYELIVPFWSDGANKARWLSVPNDAQSGAQRIKAGPEGEWLFPKGTVFVKQFELPIDASHPEKRRRLETRFLVCDADGGTYGLTYKWRADNSDADLLTTNLSEQFLIRTTSGSRTQTWYYPSRQDCRTCHTRLAGGPLGPKTRQMNRLFAYPSGVTDNQLRAWTHAGLLDPGFADSSLATLPTLAAEDDTTRSLEDRARSYLDANCSHCHRPGGTVATFDARFEVPLQKQELLNGPVLIDEGLDRARVIAPRDVWRSVALLRVSTLEGLKMPPLAHQELDQAGIKLLRDWVESLPGKPVLPPPTFSLPAGHYSESIQVGLAEQEPGATIHYTVDGSVPTSSDPVYNKPLTISRPTVLRCKAFKEGFTRSITVQQVFVIGD